MKEKKIPLRKCVITNTQHPKSEMFRIVRSPEGVVGIDLTGKAKGHGAYVVKDTQAILLAKKKKALNHFLEVEVPDSVYDQLVDLIKK